MIGNLKPYPEYKDSGLPWLGMIPKHWDVRRLKYLLREINNRSADGQEQLLRVSQYTGVTKRLSLNGDSEPDTRAASLVGYKRVEPNDIVVNIMLAWNGSLGVSRYTGIASPAYCIYRFNYQAEAWYYHHLLRQPLYKGRVKVASTGVVESRLRLYSDDLFRIEALLPDREEQRAITRFISAFDRKVEHLIRNKLQLIKLLNEQKQAKTHRAVTRGLDPKVGLKSSSIEWLGAVPEHWEVRRIKQVSSILRGKFSHRPRNDPDMYDGPYPFIQTGDVARAMKFITGYNQTLSEKGLSVSKMFPSGTLVMTIAANIGDVAVLTFDACFPDSVVGFASNKLLRQDYLYHVFLSMKSELLKEAPVNTQGNLNIERIGAMSIPVPPLDEQDRIVLEVEETTKGLIATINRARREIDLLLEYRTRLITDVVTGKLDVRTAAANLTDETVLPDDVDTIEETDLEPVENPDVEEAVEA